MHISKICKLQTGSVFPTYLWDADIYKAEPFSFKCNSEDIYLYQLHVSIQRNPTIIYVEKANFQNEIRCVGGPRLHSERLNLCDEVV